MMNPKINLQATEILESIADAFFTIDHKARFIYINKKAEKMFQRKREDLLGKNLWDEFPLTKQSPFYEKYLKLSQNPRTIRFEEYYPQVDMWFKVSAYPVNGGFAVYFNDVTKSKKAEEAVRNSEEKHRTLFETMQQGVVYHDKLGNIISVNPAAEKILGLTLKQLQGKTSMDPEWKAVREDGSDFPGDQHPAMVALKKGERVKNVVMGVHNPKDKTYRWLLVSAVPLFNKNDKEPYQVYASFEDITPLKKYERALIDAERQKDESISLLDTLLSNAPVGFAFFDKEFRFVKINKFLSDINGIPIADHIGKTITELLPTNARTVIPILKKVFKTGIPVQNVEVRGETPLIAGEERYWLTGFFPVFEYGSKRVRFVGAVVLEITEQKKAQEAVTQSEKLLRDILNNLFTFVGLLTPDGILIEANKAPLEVAKIKYEDVVGKPFWEAYWWSYSKESKDFLKEAIEKAAKGNSLRYDVEIRVANEQFITIDFALAPVFGRDGKVKYIVPSGIDITERKELEQRKDEFIGIASHELKTPLTSLKGYVQILEKIINENGDEKLIGYLRKTNNYINHLNNLITDLLDVSKIQAGKLQMDFSEFDINALLDDIVESIQQTTHSHKLIKIGSKKTVVNADKYRIEQVCSNLLTNAIKYSPGANKVIIKISRDEENVIVSVKDFGIGITQREQKRIFQRFYRVNSSAKSFSGLGIGLFISNEIIERHGGKLWVESRPLKGSTFYFKIPINLKK